MPSLFIAKSTPFSYDRKWILVKKFLIGVVSAITFSWSSDKPCYSLNDIKESLHFLYEKFLKTNQFFENNKH